MDNLLKVSILNIHSSGLFICDNSLFEKDITNFLLKDNFPNIRGNSNHLHIAAIANTDARLPQPFLPTYYSYSWQ